MNIPRTGIQLDTRRETKNGYPVKLRVTYLRTPRLYSTGIKLSREEFNKLTGDINVRGELKGEKIKLAAIEDRAMGIIKELGSEFTFDRFREKYNSKPKEVDAIGKFKEYIRKLKAQNRIGTAISYSNAQNCLNEYLGNRKLEFHTITPEWLYKYQQYMLDSGKSLTTVGIYIRSLRTIYNIAIDEGIIDIKFYPFGKRKYQVPAPRNRKKALHKNQLKKLFSYNPQEFKESKQRALDFWKFSYLCNGANPADIFRLKHADITDSSINFIREKTKRSTIQNLKNITATRTPEIDQIVKRQSTPVGSAYLFNVLDGTETPEQEKAKISQAIKVTNKWMNQIAEELGITERITFMTARHSYATMLKRGNAPTEFIQEGLGHNSKSTTENYLDSFEDDTRKEYAELLTQFD